MSLLELEGPTLQAGASLFSSVTFSNSASFSVLERIAISSSESSEPSFKFAIPAIEMGTLKSYSAMIFSVMEFSAWGSRLDDLSK